jgi:protein-S-isoprenylcysteine O-methyltransferase Ste14
MAERDAFRFLIGVPWIVFFVYWIVGMFKTRATREKEPLSSRIAILFLEIVGYLLVFNSATGIGVLGSRFIPRNLVVAILGVIFTWAGIALAIWARYHLAEYWSARVTIKEDHRLIRTGPYTHLRHPIYSGLILATLGSAVAIDEWRCILGLCLVVLGYCLKAKKEEAMLSHQFGDAFREHQKHTGFLLPNFH